MDNLESQLKDLFDKTSWDETDYARFLDLLKNTSPSAIQDFFGESYISNLSIRNPPNSARAKHLLKQIHERIGIDDTEFSKPYIPRWRPMRWIAAASVIALTGIATYIGFFRSKPAQPQTAILKIDSEIRAPRSNRATITLASGQKVFLDSVGNGTLAIQGAVRIEKLADGHIAYSGNTAELAMNTLVNPRGSKVINIKLADGSMVWLNAGSSLIYPVAFTGHERKVTISGEAYFEVTHNINMPFTVSYRGTTIQVLGTHFNVNTYEDEADIKVTLMEGSVKVVNNTNKTILKPGQQAVITDNIKVKNDVNIEQVIAWKNGLFDFSGADLPAVMKQLARWYDIQVVYPNIVPVYRFQGQLPRDLNLNQVLRALGESEVKFKIVDSTLIIL